MSYQIRHQVGISAPASVVYRAISTIEGVSGWWTKARGGEDVGNTLEFRFGDFGPDIKIEKLQPDKYVEWICISGPEAWVGTKFSFELSEGDNETFVLFKHSNWKKEDDFMAHCSLKWGVFMLSLKELVESGKGRPFPNDIKVSKNM